ncbi:Metallo-dependent phosphatase-like protein [Verticillium dahliae]|nr:Metallo-dependent phosphatase-like protein [Verticillium dahliae]
MQDLHFGENSWELWGPAQDAKTLEVMNTVLDTNPPNLVVFNGDLVTGENLFFENSTHYVDVMVAPLIERNLTWASTYGNHDYQFNVSGQGIFEREKRFSNSRTRRMVADDNAGATNYYLPVYAEDCHHCDCVPELLLWFFDSRGGFKVQERQANGADVSHPNWVDSSVVEWFRTSHARIAQRFGKTIPSLGFVHIPTQASQALQLSGVHPNHQPGINYDTPLSQQAQGWCPDGKPNAKCRYGGQDAPFMEAIASTPGMIALFSGHDHGNTWCYKWDKAVSGVDIEGNGVNLCFGQHTGYGGYGSWIRGARQVLVTREGLKHFEVETWNLLEDGRATGSVALNATYGLDSYPKVSDEHTSCNSLPFSGKRCEIS